MSVEIYRCGRVDTGGGDEGKWMEMVEMDSVGGAGAMGPCRWRWIVSVEIYVVEWIEAVEMGESR